MSLGRPAPAHHKCYRHRWVRLYREPETVDESLSYSMGHLARYYQCDSCGRIGWMRNSRRAPIVPINRSGEKDRREHASLFNSRVVPSDKRQPIRADEYGMSRVADDAPKDWQR